MKKICHIRCNKNYWEQSNVYSWLRGHHYGFLCTIIKVWNNNLNIPYLQFRKKIRDIIITDIERAKYFTVILQDNEECKKYFYTNKNKNILLYQQDDDDLFFKESIPEELTDGIKVFQYACIDPLGARRKQGFNIHKKVRLVSHLTRIQSNQSLILTNERTYEDLKKRNIWDADHTEYDSLTPDYGYTFYEHPISLQIYHLHSISLWKSLLNNNQTQYKDPEEFKKYVYRYIIELERIILESRFSTNEYILKKKSQLVSIIELYKQLIH